MLSYRFYKSCDTNGVWRIRSLWGGGRRISSLTPGTINPRAATVTSLFLPPSPEDFCDAFCVAGGCLWTPLITIPVYNILTCACIINIWTLHISVYSPCVMLWKSWATVHSLYIVLCACVLCVALTHLRDFYRVLKTLGVRSLSLSSSSSFHRSVKENILTNERLQQLNA